MAFPSFDTLQEEVQIGRRENCVKYNEVLRDMGLMVYGNAGVFSIDGQGGVSNTYARAEYSAELDGEISRLSDTHRRKYKGMRSMKELI